MVHVNLIPSHRLLARRTRRRAQRWAKATFIYALVLIGVYGYCSAHWAGGPKQVEVELVTITTQLNRTKQQTANVNRDLRGAQTTLQANRAVGDQPDWSILLTLLSNRLGDLIVLERCNLGPAHGNESDSAQPPVQGAAPRLAGPIDPVEVVRRRLLLRIDGLGRTPEAVSQFVLRLEETHLFDRVKLLETSRQDFLQGQAIRFKLECLLGGPGSDAGNPAPPNSKSPNSSRATGSNPPANPPEATQ